MIAQTSEMVEAQEAADLTKSGLSAPPTAAARAGYLPVPLEHVQVRSLAGMPIYLQTAQEGEKRFTLYSAEKSRFTDFHKMRLREAAVRFIYLPMQCHSQFRMQVERELESVATDPKVALSTKTALVYETSLELVNEVLTEGVGKQVERLSMVARAVTTLVVNEAKSFSHLFSMAQHDYYTATHMVNVGTWMTSLAYALGHTDSAVLADVCMAGMVHDVGKMFVPENVLNKTEALSEGEWGLLKAHAALGEKQLKQAGVVNECVLRVAREHHERLDGTGYPGRLKGAQMHPMSKICAVVDSFDAMTSCRPFKNRVKSTAEAVKILLSETPDKYDPEAVRAWVDLLKNASDKGVIREAVEGGDKNPGRRRHERFSINCPLQFRELTPAAEGWIEGTAQAGKAHNISRGGLGLLASKPLKLGCYLRVQLKGKGTMKDRVVEGQVVRCRLYQDGYHDIGLSISKAGEQEAASAKVMEEG
jgi:HD-GYP domain-containing protein (c-di-GMP phosphodiesterase class II)